MSKRKFLESSTFLYKTFKSLLYKTFKLFYNNHFFTLQMYTEFSVSELTVISG